MELKIQDLKAYVEFIKSQTPEGLFIVGGTGHRAYYDEVDLTTILTEIKPTSIISGMADGWDIALAKSSLNLNIPLAAAIPFHGHEKKGEYQDILNNTLTSAYYICSEGGYEVWKLHRRNEWMADRANLMLAFWDGNKKGGTFNCIEYCRKKNIPWINLWDKIKVGVK